MHPHRRLGWLAAISIVAACGGDAGGGPTPIVVPPTPVVTTVAVAPGTNTVEVGSSVTFDATVRDQSGNAMSGQTISWTSGSPAVATINSASGVVTGVAAGTATITASVAGKSASATVTVVPPAVFTVSIAALQAPLLPGQSAQLSTTLKDRTGAVLVNRVVAWSTSAAAVATVDNAGGVTAVSAGTATVFATSEGIVGAITVTVSGAGGSTPPTITGITPATLIPGGTATLTGTNFDPVAANNVVTVGGVAVNVTSATATQLVVSALPCVSSGGASIKVTTNALAGPAFTHPVAVPQRTVPIGQSIVLTSPGCNELVASGNARYIISVFSVSSTENALTDFELTGNTSAGGSPARIPIVAPAFASAPLAPGPDAARDREHYAQLERNRAIFREGQSLTARQPLRSRSALAAAPLPVIGDQRDFFYTYTGGCRDTTTRMHTKAIYVGTRSIIWEDSTNTLLARNDPALAGYYQRLGQIFDQDQYDVIKTNFGDPLRRDISLANDGRVHMVFSE
ncbi:MAG: Ig-like domain-containing protein, partial [bacterium]